MKIYITLIAMLATATGFTQRTKVDSAREAQKTEVWLPVPAIVTPGKTSVDAPSDAIILFNGTDTKSWVNAKTEKETEWQIEADGALTVTKGSGSLKSKQAFGNCQLHIEWRQPTAILSSGQSRGNSGIFFMGLYELQVLDSYQNPTYSNGQAGSIYKEHIPLVNVCRQPGEWQTYDAVFTAPKFAANGKLVSPARITVLHNGVLIQNNVAIEGETKWIGKHSYKKHNEKEPLILQDHGLDGGNPISYRNIWIREL